MTTTVDHDGQESSHELEAAQLIASKEFLGNDLAYQLARMFEDGLYKLRVKKFDYWCVDDFLFDTYKMGDAKLSLRGKVFWLSGGDNTEGIKVDVGIDTKPMLYSFKLYETYGSNKQKLYIAKGQHTWVLNSQ